MLSVAVDVGSLFVKSGPLVYQTGRDGNRNPIDVNPRRYLGLNTPLVVLVNKNSASGSEIIAAGVRAQGAGTVMGTRTAGCVGSGQPRDLPDGGLLLVTLTKMQDAKTGEDLNGPGKGVVPDQTVEDDAARARESVDRLDRVVGDARDELLDAHIGDVAATLLARLSER